MKKRVLENNMENIIMLLYKSVAHPHFEYNLQIWSPHPSKKKVDIEQIWRMAIKMIKVKRMGNFLRREKEHKHQLVSQGRFMLMRLQIIHELSPQTWNKHYCF